MSSNSVDRAAAENAWLRTCLMRERRAAARTGQASDGAMLAAAADREHAVDVLKSGYAEGRLTKDEFDARAGRALTARTFADLTAAAAGLLGWPARPVPVSRPGRRPSPGTGRPAPDRAGTGSEGARSASISAHP